DNRAKHLLSTRPVWLALAPIGGAAAGILAGLALAGSGDPAAALHAAPSSAWLLPGCALAGAAAGYVIFLMPLLTLFAIAGALIGGLLHVALEALGWSAPIAGALLHHQVSPEFVARAAA